MSKNLIKNLSSNEEETRNNNLNVFINWLYDNPSTFQKENWWGIFYFIYHLDNKILEQQKTLNDLSKIFKNLNFDYIIVHLKYFFDILNEKISLIDIHRINKFLFIIKKILIAVYYNLFCNLSKLNISKLNEVMVFIFLKFDKSISLELIENFNEIFNSIKNIKVNTIFLIFKPLMDCLSISNDKVIKNKILNYFENKYIEIIFNKINNINDIEKFINYFFKYASNNEIEDNNRKLLYKIIEISKEKLENFQEKDEVDDNNKEFFNYLKENDEVINLIDDENNKNLLKTNDSDNKDYFVVNKNNIFENGDLNSFNNNNNKNLNHENKEINNNNNNKMKEEVLEINKGEVLNINKGEVLNINKGEVLNINNKEIIEVSSDEENYNKDEIIEIDQNEKNDVDKKKEKNDENNIENENIEYDENFFLFKDYNIPSDEEFETIDDIFKLVKKYCPEKYKECLDKFKDYDLADLAENNEEMDENYNPYENMSFEEMKEKLPKYFFLNPKKKKKFFNKLNKNFIKELKERKSKKIKKISFRMSDMKIKNFKKEEIIDKNSLIHK